jgi:hypothetical protein
MAQFELEEASAAFDEVFHLRPDAYLWQAGIVKYYLGELQTAANIFAQSAMVYESKFGGKASEERIWRHACELKMATLQKATSSKSLKKSRIAREDLHEIRSSLVPMPDVDESLLFETRKAVRIAGDLFEASVDNDAGREL